MIVPEDGKYVLYTRDGKHILGTHESYDKALAQERAIQISKAGMHNMKSAMIRENLILAVKTAAENKILSTNLAQRHSNNNFIIRDKSGKFSGLDSSNDFIAKKEPEGS